MKKYRSRKILYNIDKETPRILERANPRFPES
nr:MAG TPA: hypothetical protein [Caudoviricetes sp.]DAQ20463.1 MAG TPA: hypothetical protein [Caudoviricetes sp.]